MEPIIYKPGAYKSPGIYNGAGDIYNDRGVYKDGASISGLIYETDFSNFDTNTLIDYPLIGKETQYSISGNFTKTTRTIDGVEKTCLHLNQGVEIVFYYIDFNDFEILSVEYIVNKDSYQGLGCGGRLSPIYSGNPVCPFYNCYTSDRGLGALNVGTPQPGFNSYSWGVANTDSSERDVIKLSISGSTLIKDTKEMKFFIRGKKAAKRILSSTYYGSSPAITAYTDNSYNTQMNLYGIRIYKNKDIYEQME